MKKKVICLLMVGMLAASVPGGCGNKDADSRAGEVMDDLGTAIENGDEDAAMAALEEWDRIIEEEAAVDPSGGEGVYPADPRWADVKPTEVAVQLNDVFIKTGMPFGEVLEQVKNSDTFFVQFEKSMGYDPDPNAEVTADTRVNNGVYRLGDWTSYFITLDGDHVFDTRLTALPGKEGDVYSLKDIPITNMSIFPATVYSTPKHPEVYRTALGTNEDITNMSSKDVENLKDTFFAGLDVEMKSERQSYEGVNYIDYTYTVPSGFSWNGYAIEEFTISYVFNVNYEEDRVTRWWIGSDCGENIWFAE